MAKVVLGLGLKLAKVGWLVGWLAKVGWLSKCNKPVLVGSRLPVQ